MAILKNYDSDMGVSFPEAYWMIARVDIERRERKVSVMVDVFASQAARAIESKPVGGFFATITDAEDYDRVLEEGLPALYEMLKRNDIMAGGVDA